MLGPMVNPAFPPNQLVGVFSLELARLYGYLYQNTDKNFSIIHALDGYDEISLTGSFKLISNRAETLVSLESIGFRTLEQEELYGGEQLMTRLKYSTPSLPIRAMKRKCSRTFECRISHSDNTTN